MEKGKEEEGKDRIPREWNGKDGEMDGGGRYRTDRI